MSNQLVVKNTVTIHAPAAKVWDALVNPEQTKKYMFNCETDSDWKTGSPLLWKMQHEGQELIAVEGTILEIVPEKRLVYTTIDPNNEMDKSSGNYLRVTYDLSEENGYTTLNVSQGDYSTVAEGARRFKEAMDAGGWDHILQDIKKILE